MSVTVTATAAVILLFLPSHELQIKKVSSNGRNYDPVTYGPVAESVNRPDEKMYF